MKRDEIRLGRTGIQVNRNGFGALPIQRISKQEAGCLKNGSRK